MKIDRKKTKRSRLVARRWVDAIRVLIAPLVILSVPVALAEEPPPYPYGYPAWMVALQEKLKVPMSVDWKGIPFREALEKISSATGVSIRIDREVREAGSKPVSLFYKDQPAEKVLSLLLTILGLGFKFKPTGLVVVHPDDPDLQSL